MSSQAAKRKAKDKAYYIKSAKQAKKAVYELGPGVKGFLCTSNNRERESIREAYNILNEFAEPLYGKETADDKNAAEEPREEEIEDELEKELENPNELMNAILKELEEKRQQKCRFLLRMTPIVATCKSVPDDILATAKPIAVELLKNFKTFSILYKVKNNSVKREDIIEPLATHIKAELPEITVDLDNPEASIVVEAKKEESSEEEEEKEKGSGSGSESGSESDEGGATKGKDGAAPAVDVENPNRLVKKTKKVEDINVEEKAPLSRREREELEKQRAKEHYQKLHAQGKTDEARADLARLAIIKQQREEAAKKREDEKKQKEAQAQAKTASIKKAMGK
nr:EOG090X0GPG [Sida crystallina]